MRGRRRLVIILLLSLVLAVISAFSSCKAKTAPSISAEYAIELVVPETLDKVYLTEEVNFVNFCDVELTEVVFYLYPLFVDYGVCDGGGIVMGNVTDGASELDYTVDGILLKVSLAQALKSGERATLRMGATLIAKADSRYVRSDDGVLTLLRFYPTLACLGKGGFELTECSNIGDAYKVPSADYELTVRAERGISVVASGKEQVCEDGAKRYVTRNARGIGVAFTEGGEVKSASNGTFTVRALGYEGNAVELLKMLEDIASLTGDYPYGALSVVFGGSKRTESGSGIIVLPRNSANTEVAYGMAKQWFGGYVGCDGYNEGWVSDAISEHIATFVVGAEEYGTLLGGNRSALESYRRAMAVRYGDEGYTVRIDECVTYYDTRQAYDVVARKGGCAIYATLVELIGTKKYAECVRAYVERYGGSNVSGAELIASFSETSGIDVGGIFGAYLGGEVKRSV